VDKVIRRPVSRVLCHSPRYRRNATTIHLRHALQRAWRDLPGWHSKACVRFNPRPSLFGLAPGGACRAPFLTVGAVRSYRTVSPLPVFAEAMAGGLFSVALSLGSPPPGITRHLAFPEPGLSSLAPFRDMQERPPSRLIAIYVVVFGWRVKRVYLHRQWSQSARRFPHPAGHQQGLAGIAAGRLQSLPPRQLQIHIPFLRVV